MKWRVGVVKSGLALPGRCREEGSAAGKGKKAWRG